MTTKKRPLKLRKANAYFRLAGKAERTGNFRLAGIYRDTANRLVNQNRADAARLKQQFGA